MASHSEEVTGSSFDAFLKECSDRSSIGELMGGQALLWDYTTAEELKQLGELANIQVKIACHFDTKFSNIAFTLLQKTHEVFINTGGIAQMVDCMTFMDEGFDSLRKFSDTLNVSPFVLVIVGMAITHHSLLTIDYCVPAV